LNTYFLLPPYHSPHNFFKQIAAALEKAEIDIPADTKAKLSACFASSGVIALANAIKDMRAISSVNLLMNNIPMEQAKALASILKEHPTLKSLCGNSGEEAELDMSGKEIEAEGAIMLAPEIAGTLSVLSLKKNRLCTKEAGKALAQALAGNTTLKELDVSDNQSPYGDNSARDGPGFAQKLAVGIRDNGAIVQFTFSGDSDDSTPITMETSMVEANFGGKGLGISGAIMVAAFLPKCT
jgi:hypothetical protein